MISSYLIWNGNPDIFTVGSFALRWYGLLFAMGFLVSQQILYYIFKKEGKPETDVDTLTIYMVIATVLGARLGHVIFYQPEMFWEAPLQIIVPFEFTPEFKFTGLQGLASHGGAFGILFALWLYSRKRKPGQNYLQTLDRIVIVVAITGALIRMGNFFNSEIIGKPTDSSLGIVFINPVVGQMTSEKTPLVESYDVRKDTSRPVLMNGRVPLNIFLFFKKDVTQEDATRYLKITFKRYLVMPEAKEFVDENFSSKLDYELSFDETSKSFGARVHVLGISRHPAQLYESISCVLLFLFLFWVWTRRKVETPEGRIFGLFMVILWTLRFSYEFLKENQVTFENDLPLNMGQILSIPLVLVGIWILIRSYRVKNEKPAGENI